MGGRGGLWRSLAVAALLGLVALAAAQPARAGTIPFPQSDVLFVFDTTGSMEEAIDEAKAEIGVAMSQIDAKLPDVQFGLAEVRDYGGSSYDEESPGDLPWRLVTPIGPDPAAVDAGLAGLEAVGGGDTPEAYGRALWESAFNPTVGWRPGTRHMIVLVADDVPHDPELNEGIPESVWYESSPWDTGAEIGAAAGIASTPWTPGVSLDWQTVLGQLAAVGAPLQFVNYQGDLGYLPYWEHWAARTGGRAVYADAGGLVEDLVGVTGSAAVAAACRSVPGPFGKRLLASLKCSAARTWLSAQCGVEISLGKALKALSTSKRLIKVSKVRRGWRPLARLVNHIKLAKFGRRAPKGFRSGPEVIDKLRKVDTAWDLVRTLRHIAKAVSPADFRRIAIDIGDVAGARTCVEGLLAAVE